MSPRASGGTVHARPRRDDDAAANATYQTLAGRRRRQLDLAAYEIKELGEGFDDIVKYHPTHEESPVAPKDAIPRIVTAPVEGLRAAIQKKDGQAFVPAFDALTQACNNCHQATNFGFNIVQRPATNPYPNQVFTLAAK